MDYNSNEQLTNNNSTKLGGEFNQDTIIHQLFSVNAIQSDPIVESVFFYDIFTTFINNPNLLYLFPYDLFEEYLITEDCSVDSIELYRLEEWSELADLDSSNSVIAFASFPFSIISPFLSLHSQLIKNENINTVLSFITIVSREYHKRADEFREKYGEYLVSTVKNAIHECFPEMQFKEATLILWKKLSSKHLWDSSLNSTSEAEYFGRINKTHIIGVLARDNTFKHQQKDMLYLSDEEVEEIPSLKYQGHIFRKDCHALLLTVVAHELAHQFAVEALGDKDFWGYERFSTLLYTKNELSKMHLNALALKGEQEWNLYGDANKNNNVLTLDHIILEGFAVRIEEILIRHLLKEKSLIYASLDRIALQYRLQQITNSEDIHNQYIENEESWLVVNSLMPYIDGYLFMSKIEASKLIQFLKNIDFEECRKIQLYSPRYLSIFNNPAEIPFNKNLQF